MTENNSAKFEFNLSDFYREMRADPFVNKARIPLGYAQGYPMILGGDDLKLAVPYLRYKITGVADETMVFPIRYIFVYSIKNTGFTGFYDLRTVKCFSGINYGKPVGLFRHEAVKNLNKNEYREKQKELYGAYSAVLTAALNGEEPDPNTEAQLRSLLGLLLEPSLKPFYRVFAPDFFNKYLAD